MRLWRWAISVMLIYAVTIAIFPSLTVTIAPSGGGCVWKELFGPLNFVVFNLGDTIGRNMPYLLRRPSWILALCVARLIFAPLFMLCYTGSGDNAGPMQLPVFAGFDALPITLMLIFSVTNGWFTTSIMVSSQEHADMPPALRQQGVTLLCMCLNSGIFVGAALSFVIRYLNCTPSEANGFDCNPFLTQAGNLTDA